MMAKHKYNQLNTHTHTWEESERERETLINTYIIAMLQHFLSMAFDEPFIFLSLYISLLFIRLTFLSGCFAHFYHHHPSDIHCRHTLYSIRLLFSRLPLNNWVMYRCVCTVTYALYNNQMTNVYQIEIYDFRSTCVSAFIRHTLIHIAFDANTYQHSGSFHFIGPCMHVIVREKETKINRPTIATVLCAVWPLISLHHSCMSLNESKQSNNNKNGRLHTCTIVFVTSNNETHQQQQQQQHK